MSRSAPGVAPSIIVRQMTRSVRIEEVGDTEFLVDEQVDRFRFNEENGRILLAGGKPARGRPLRAMTGRGLGS